MYKEGATSFLLLITVIENVVGQILTGGGDLFDYEKGGKDWPGVCTTGTRQSPIDLYNSMTENYDPKRKERLSILNYKDANTIINLNDHSFVLKMVPREKQKIGFMGSGLKEFYNLDSVHMHWRSEHSINADKSTDQLEIHFVHYKKSYGEVKKAAESKDPAALAVLGVIMKIGEKNDELQKVINILEKADKQVAENSTSKTETISLDKLVPRSLHEYYRYEGSLTTPPCTEIVVWTVFARKLTLSKEQAYWFESYLTLDGEVRSNNRILQEVGNRTVYGVGIGDDDFDESANNSPKFFPNLLSLFFIIFWSF